MHGRDWDGTFRFASNNLITQISNKGYNDYTKGFFSRDKWLYGFKVTEKGLKEVCFPHYAEYSTNRK